MLESSDSLFLAQGVDWIEGAIILAIVLISAIGSAGKWIVQKLAEQREEQARRRAKTFVEFPSEPAEVREDHLHQPRIPAPPQRPARRTIESAQPPVMERVLEVLLERTTGTTLERPVREIVQKAQPVRPPPPPKKAQPAPKPKPVRTSIAQRERQKEELLAQKAERLRREAARIEAREDHLPEEIDLRLGHVETHIAPEEAATPADEMAVSDPFARVSIQDALLIHEILSPPLALRKPSFGDV